MDFIVTDKYGQDKGYLNHCGGEFIVGQDDDFEIKIPSALFLPDRHQKNCRVFAEDTVKWSTVYSSV